MAIFNSYVKLPEGTMVDPFSRVRVKRLEKVHQIYQQKTPWDGMIWMTVPEWLGDSVDITRCVDTSGDHPWLGAARHAGRWEGKGGELRNSQAIWARRQESGLAIDGYTHDGSMVLVYTNIKGVYWWDPCYHIYHTWILWDMIKSPM